MATAFLRSSTESLFFTVRRNGPPVNGATVRDIVDESCEDGADDEACAAAGGSVVRGLFNDPDAVGKTVGREDVAADDDDEAAGAADDNKVAGTDGAGVDNGGVVGTVVGFDCSVALPHLTLAAAAAEVAVAATLWPATGATLLSVIFLCVSAFKKQQTSLFSLPLYLG